MSRALNDLDLSFRPVAMELLARCVEANLPVMIINTRRTAAEQQANLAKGVSWVTHSKHQDGLAIDIAPWAVWQEYGPDKLQWDGDDPVWVRLGAIGEGLGLVWGGRWKQRDLGHFEKAPLAKALNV